MSVVRLVLCRSSLHINSELAAAAALAAWTAATCARLQLEPAPDTVRQAAAGCQYLVRSVIQSFVFPNKRIRHKKLTFSSRYLTLTPEEFRRGPMVSGLLTEDEADSILFALLRPDTALPDHLAPLRRTMSQPRHRLVEVRTAD